jgi:hypothetical protein
MPRPRYPHTHQEFGRKRANGQRRVMWYFRIGQGLRTRLKGDYGSPEFVAHYRALLTASAAFPAPVLNPVMPQGRSPENGRSWQSLRYRALKLHGAKCQCCGADCSSGKPLHVDHIKPKSKFPEFRQEISNLQVLCEDCNLGKGTWDQTDWRRLDVTPAQPRMIGGKPP